MIKSFADSATERTFQGGAHRRIPADIRLRAMRKLTLLHAATDVNDLRVPPGNRLEQLVGDRAGQHSIRINQQWRICFRWENGNAYDVEITDYHS